MYKETFRIAEKSKKDIINPYYLLCIAKNCKRKKSIRTYSFLNFPKLIPASIIHEIILYFLIDMKNTKEIEKLIKYKRKKSPNYSTINKIVLNLRCCIAEYIKTQYKIYKLEVHQNKIELLL